MVKVSISMYLSKEVNAESQKKCLHAHVYDSTTHKDQ